MNALFRLISLLLALTVVAGPAHAAPLTLYTSRDTDRVTPVLRAFTARTGIEVDVIQQKEGLLEALGKVQKPGDLLLVEEFGVLLEAQRLGLTQAVKSPALEQTIHPAFRDPDGHWFGLSRYARVVYAAKSRVTATAFRYEDLADPAWKGRLCVRSGKHAYNVALIASMIAHHGRDWTKTWLSGVKANLARPPKGNDREQVKAIAEGVCDLALGNSYYYAAMQAEPQQRAWAEAARVIAPNAEDRGAHVSVSGIALLRNAPNAELAIKLINYLASAEGQQIYALLQNTYPVTPELAASNLAGAGAFLRADTLPLTELARLSAEARSLIDEVQFDAGQ